MCATYILYTYNNILGLLNVDIIYQRVSAGDIR